MYTKIGPPVSEEYGKNVSCRARVFYILDQKVPLNTNFQMKSDYILLKNLPIVLNRLTITDHRYTKLHCLTYNLGQRNRKNPSSKNTLEPWRNMYVTMPYAICLENMQTNKSKYRMRYYFIILKWKLFADKISKRP